ncbi:hypothetical protein [Rhodococcus koreensis]
MTDVVLIDAGRSAVVPDDPDLPETPAAVAAEVISTLLRRAGVEQSDVTDLFLADPRFLTTGADSNPDGWVFERPPLHLPTTVSSRSALSVVQAVRAVRNNPDTVAVVAATDFGSSGDAELERQQARVRAVAAEWDVASTEMTSWARSSYERSTECSDGGDFADEIVSATAGYAADDFQALPPDDRAVSHQSRGVSAMLLMSERNAAGHGLGFRARLHAACTDRTPARGGVGPFGARLVDQLLGPVRIGIRELDQLEVPEQFPVTPLAWIKATGISRDLVNPRGGDLGFGHLFRSGHLRSLVTMVNSLEATGGRAGALLASDLQRAAAFVLTR